LSFGHLEESPGNREEWSISLAERGTSLAFGRWPLVVGRWQKLGHGFHRFYG